MRGLHTCADLYGYRSIVYMDTDSIYVDVSLFAE